MQGAFDERGELVAHAHAAEHDVEHFALAQAVGKAVRAEQEDVVRAGVKAQKVDFDRFRGAEGAGDVVALGVVEGLAGGDEAA